MKIELLINDKILELSGQVQHQTPLFHDSIKTALSIYWVNSSSFKSIPNSSLTGFKSSKYI